MSAAATARVRTPEHSPTSQTDGNRRTAMARRQSRLRWPKKYSDTGPVDNNVRVPHAFWGLAGRDRLSGVCQMSVLGLLMSASWGDLDHPVWVCITIDEFSRELKFASSLIERVLADSCQQSKENPRGRGLIERRKVGKRCEYRLRPDNWPDVAKYVAEATAAAEDAEESEDEAASNDAETRADAATYAIAPGKRSKPIPLSLTVKGSTEPVRVEVECHNQIRDLGLFVGATAGKNGRISVSVREGDRIAIRHGGQGGEDKANDYPTGVGQSAKSPHSHRTPDVSPQPSHSEQFSEYKTYLDGLMPAVWGKVPDATFVARIVATAAGAPAALFEEIVSQRLQKAGTRSKKDGLQSGILISLASDAAESFSHQTKRTARDRDATREAGELRAAFQRDWPEEPRETPWGAILLAVRQQISDVSYTNWLRRSRMVELAGTTLVVEVPDEGTRAFIEDEYGAVIATTARALRGGLIKTVRFVAVKADV